MPALPPEVQKEILAFEAAKDYENPRYMELLMGNFYTEHVLHLPLEQWPEPLNRAFAKLNRKVYVPLQVPLRPWVLFEVGPIQLAHLAAELPPAPVVRPGGVHRKGRGRGPRGTRRIRIPVVRPRASAVQGDLARRAARVPRHSIDGARNSGLHPDHH